MKGSARILSVIVLTICIFSLSACGEKDTYAPKDENAEVVVSEEKNTDKASTEGKLPEEAVTEPAEPDLPKGSPSDPANSADEVLKTMEITFENGEFLTLSVIGKKRDDVELYGVREIRVYKDDRLLQSISMKEAIDRDGVDGIEEGYTACFTAEDSAGLKDVNFDGYLDLEVCGWTPNNSLPYYYWCWNNDTQQFEYSFCLQLTEIDEENKQLIAWYKVENGLYYTDYYHVNDKNELELIKRDIEDVRPKE